MRVAANSAMVAEICGHVFAQRRKSGDARGLVMKNVSTFVAQGASAHPVPREQREEAHIRLTRPEWSRRREVRLDRRGSCRSFYCCRRSLRIARHGDWTAQEDC